jgi:glycosyltransferase involved in cell wall biosynthesis
VTTATAPRRRSLVVIQSPVYGGSHNEAKVLAPLLAAAGWGTTVVLPSEPGNAATRLRAAGIEVVEMPLHRLRSDPLAALGLVGGMPREVARLADLIRERDIDLVRAVGIVHPHGALAARRAGVAVIWQVSDLSAPAALRRMAMPVAVRLSDAMSFNGHRLLEVHRQSARITMTHAAYYPPVDTRVFAPPDARRRSAARQALGLSDGDLVVGSVANVNPDKGLEYLVRAAPAVLAAEPRARFVVVGATYANHAAYAEGLRAELVSLGIDEDRFTFAGERDDTAEVYAALDVHVVSSVREGTTTTALEAMATGIPVVASDVGAVHEVVIDGKTGLLVPARRPHELAEAIVILLRDAAWRGRLGAAGRHDVERRFSAQQCAALHVRLFEAALEHHHRKRRPEGRARE